MSLCSSFDRYGFSMAHATASREEALTDPLMDKARKLDQQALRALEVGVGGVCVSLCVSVCVCVCVCVCVSVCVCVCVCV